MVNEFDILKINMKDMLKHSKKEFSKYQNEKEHDPVYLQQAGEKLFNVFCRYLEYKYHVMTSTHTEIRELAMKDSRNFELMIKLDALHNYFYHGELKLPQKGAERIYIEIVKSLENRINNL